MDLSFLELVNFYVFSDIVVQFFNYNSQVITTDQGTAICTPNMGNLSSNVISVQDWNTYNIMMVLLQYPIPLFIISLTYGHMARVID